MKHYGYHDRYIVATANTSSNVNDAPTAVKKLIMISVA